MTTIQLTSTEKTFIELLKSNNKEKIVEALDSIVSEGSPTLILPLIELFSQTTDSEIEKQVYEMLCGLKNTQSIPIIIKAIDNKEFTKVKHKLVSVCWQNGLDYAPFFNIFVELFINETFETAFEAFTVIENMENIDNQSIINNISKLKKSATESTNDKQALFVELVHLLEKRCL